MTRTGLDFCNRNLTDGLNRCENLSGFGLNGNSVHPNWDERCLICIRGATQLRLTVGYLQKIPS
jgi:hypothetical protein